MKQIFLFFTFFLLRISSLEPPQIHDFLKSFLTPDNHRQEVHKFRSSLRDFDSMNASQQEAYLSKLKENDDSGFNEFLMKNRALYTNKTNIKHIIKLFPSILFESNDDDFGLSSEFEQFLEEIEGTYTDEHIEDFDRRTLYSEEALDDKMLILKTILSKGEDPDLIENLKSKRENKRKTPKRFDFVKDEHRERFKDLLDDFFEEKLQKNPGHFQEKLNTKLELHKEHYENKSRSHHNSLNNSKKNEAFPQSNNFYETLNEIPIPSTDPAKDHLKANYSKLITHIQSLDSLIASNNFTHQDLQPHLLENSTDFLLGLDHLLRLDTNISNYHLNSSYSSLKSLITPLSRPSGFNISFLEIKQDFSSGLNSLDNGSEECMSSELKKAASAAMDDLSSAVDQTNAEDSETQVKKKEVAAGKSGAQQSMQMKMIIQLIKMVINAIVSIITGFFRIIVPPVILAFFSCPEASVFPENLINIINFDEKTDQLLQKIEAYPAFFETFAADDASSSQYYMCAQGLFTSECSALWPGFNFITFLITQPPFTVIPFLLFMPILDWLQILPGDMPMCFLCCIQVLLQCKGIKFSEIPQCGGLYNLDTLLRAISDLALLVFLGFSMVPGMCSYWPFIINMWMIPPRLMTEEAKMLRRAPKLKALLNEVKKPGNDAKNAANQANCDKKQQEKSEKNQDASPFGNPEDVQSPNQNSDDNKNDTKEPEDMNPELMGQLTGDWGHPEPMPDDWSTRYLDDDYKVEHWEKNKHPEDTIKDEWERKMVAGVEGEGINSPIHETQSQKIDLGDKKNIKTVSGNIGERNWDYQKE